MSLSLLTLYQSINSESENIYYFIIDTSYFSLDIHQFIKQNVIQFLFPQSHPTSTLSNSKVIYGNKLNVQSPWGSNVLNIFHNLNYNYILRVEKLQATNKNISLLSLDSLTQQFYMDTITLSNFNMKILPNPIIKFDSLHDANKKYNLNWDSVDISYYQTIFGNRKPTDTEILDLAQYNSEHSRHWLFKGKIIIDKIVQDKTMFQLVQDTLPSISNSTIAFSDNASALIGYPTLQEYFENTIFKNRIISQAFTLTAETHNFPTGIAPFPGAATGIGGRIRDTIAIGRGGEMVAGTAGYSVGDFKSTNYTLHSPQKILHLASDGASDYGNKIGEPIIGGFTRSFGNIIQNKILREWVKPIMFTAGLGKMNLQWNNKIKPESHMLVVRIGGPAYRIGVNGGIASSQDQTSQQNDFYQSAVQRGDPEMENKVVRAIKCLIQLSNNPILAIHDQGAGGMGNVTKEIVEPLGAIINLNQVLSGDSSLSATELWIAEYQEQVTILAWETDYPLIEKICKRERVPVRNVGKVSGNKYIKAFYQSESVVDLPLAPLFENIPQKEYNLTSTPLPYTFLPSLNLPSLNLSDILTQVITHPTVGSKRFLIHKVDRSVTGLIAQQQGVGCWETPVSNYSLIVSGYHHAHGCVTAVGEQPIYSLLDPTLMVKMTIMELLTNIIWVKIGDITSIKCSANWMWPAKSNKEKYYLYLAVQELSKICQTIGLSIDGGKDSLSMSSELPTGKSDAPGTLVLTGYAPCDNIYHRVTPELQQVGNILFYIPWVDISQFPLDASILAQCNNQIGNKVANINLDDFKYLVRGWKIIQQWIGDNKIYSGHDISDGGLLTTLLEMSITSGIGLDISIPNSQNIVPFLFSQAPAIVIEVSPNNIPTINDLFPTAILIATLIESPDLQIYDTSLKKYILSETSIDIWRQKWEKNSYSMELLQSNQFTAHQEWNSHLFRQKITPHFSTSYLSLPPQKFKVAIIREEGSNGDKEMIHAFDQAGFTVVEFTMSDLISINKNPWDNTYRGIVFVGGFSYSDVLGAGKGWASIINFHTNIKEWIEAFYNRDNTFILGVCNGCQVMTQLGWFPGVTMGENLSNKFESRFSHVKIQPSNSIFFSQMDNSILGVWVAHKEGRFIVNSDSEFNVPVAYVDDLAQITTTYPFNPNGSPQGIAAISSISGRHLAIMPHPERCIYDWQVPYNNKIKQYNNRYPWFRMFQNAYQWCLNYKVSDQIVDKLESPDSSEK